MTVLEASIHSLFSQGYPIPVFAFLEDGKRLRGLCWSLADNLPVGTVVGQVRQVASHWRVLAERPCVYTGVAVYGPGRWCFRDQGGSASQIPLTPGGVWYSLLPVVCLVLPGQPGYPAEAGVDRSRFPDTCLRCGSPAYLGAGVGECSREDCR